MRKRIRTFPFVIGLVTFASLGVAGCSCFETPPKVAPKEDVYKINHTYKALYIGNTLQLYITKNDELYTANVEWSSSDAGVATVDSNGLVTAVAPGTCTISALINGRLYLYCVVVVENDSVTIQISKTELTLTVGDIDKVNIINQREQIVEGKLVSTNPKVATIDEEGNVYAYQAGTAVIQAFYNNVLMGQCEVTVNGRDSEIYRLFDNHRKTSEVDDGHLCLYFMDGGLGERNDSICLFGYDTFDETCYLESTRSLYAKDGTEYEYASYIEFPWGNFKSGKILGDLYTYNSQGEESDFEVEFNGDTLTYDSDGIHLNDSSSYFITMNEIGSYNDKTIQMLFDMISLSYEYAESIFKLYNVDISLVDL